ncbi:expressed unknown protein [Seminavis robusta]|uniref:Uncharacterized protein n=1 Tax=Seminavis robusta TaxID=568900 RepID=A0A9N8DU28_9STRA|nr:expressed unknown protein [Seminavis robusta]|eukprot:Sro372_g128720.1 n/a (87) ;mRNA; r:15971-16231
MVSSVGVAPVEATYGDSIQVEKLYFFGAALRTDAPSQAAVSMIHAVTFRDELNCMFNFVSPGIAQNFAEESVKEIKQTLISFATEL